MDQPHVYSSPVYNIGVAQNAIKIKNRLDINNLPNVTPIDKGLYLGWNCTISFGKLFLPGDFMQSENSFAHYEISRELEQRTTKPLAIIIARDHAKTTIIKAHIVRDFCYTRANMLKFSEWAENPELKQYWLEEAKARLPLFYGWVSNTTKKSQENVAYVAKAITENIAITSIFGNLNGKPYGKTWTKEEIVTINDDKLISRSNLSSLRGETHSSMVEGVLSTIRYIKVFIDDAENEENTKTRNARHNLVNTIMKGIYPAIDKERGRMYLMETPVHYASFAQKLLDEKHRAMKEGTVEKMLWKVIDYAATQPGKPGGVLWPARYSKEKLAEQLEVYKHSPGGASGYYQEYELLVQSEETAIWIPEHIKYWDGTFVPKNQLGYTALIIGGEVIPVKTYIGCDPSTDIDTRNADFSAICVIAIDANWRVYVLEYIHEVGIPNISLRGQDGKIIGQTGIVNHLMDLYQKYECDLGTIEDVGMNRGVFQALYAEQLRTGRMKDGFLPEPPGGKDKHNRIYSGLATPMAMGMIHIREGMRDLKYQILTFGERMIHDDLIESLHLAYLNASPPRHVVLNQTTKKAVAPVYSREYMYASTPPTAAKPWTHM